MLISNRLACVAAVLLACTLANAQFQATGHAATTLAIPPTGSGGSPGGCSFVVPGPNTTSFSVTVNDTFVVNRVRVSIDLVHSYVGDLRIALHHYATEVVLYDRTPGSSKDLNGVYTFDDQGILFFANALAAPGTVVTPNTYIPINPLSPFIGTNSGGLWTLTICDNAPGDVGILHGFGVELFGDDQFGGTVSPPLQIPDGTTTCVAPVTRAINVVSPGTVDTLDVVLGLTHPFLRDLDIAVAHDGVVVHLSNAGTMFGGAGGNSLFTFSDDAGQTWDGAAAVAGFGTIPQGAYRPDEPLAAFRGHPLAGVWLITVCDSQFSDTGSLTHAGLVASRSPYAVAFAQSGPGQSVTVINSGAAPYDHYVNLITLVPGTFPNGWLNGLDISFADVVTQVNLGPPFFGIVDINGVVTTSIPGPIPSGIAVQITSFELNAQNSPVASVRAFQYVTQ